MSFSFVLPKLEFYGAHKTSPAAWKSNLEIGDLKIPVAVYLIVRWVHIFIFNTDMYEYMTNVYYMMMLFYNRLVKLIL